MAQKPTQNPSWVTNNSATEMTEPTPSLKINGVQSGGIWGREHLNWMFNAHSKWVDYIREYGLDKENSLSELTDKPTAFNNIKQDATTSLKGVVEKATQAEMTAGTADKFPDAATIKANTKMYDSAGTERMEMTTDGVVVKGAFIESGSTALTTAHGLRAKNSEGGLMLLTDGGDATLYTSTNAYGSAKRVISGTRDAETTLYFNDLPRLDTSADGVIVNSGDPGKALVDVRNTEGGVSLWTDGGEFYLSRTNSAGASGSTIFNSTSGNGGQIRYAGNVKLETTSLGVDVLDGRLRVTKASTSAANLYVRNSRVGYGLTANSDGTSVQLDFLDGTGATTDRILKATVDGATVLSHNGIDRLETSLLGSVTRGSQSLVVSTDGTATEVRMQNSEGSTQLRTDGGHTYLVSGNDQAILTYTRSGATVITYNGADRVATTNDGARVTGILEVTGHIVSTNKKLSQEAMGIYSGDVSADGTITTLPTNWTLSKGGNGSYTLNFNTTLGNAPTVTVSVRGGFNFVSISSISNTSFSISIVSTGQTAVNERFCFHVTE